MCAGQGGGGCEWAPLSGSFEEKSKTLGVGYFLLKGQTIVTAESEKGGHSFAG